MELTSTRIERVPEKTGRVRLVGEVTYDDGATDSYWFEVSEKYADYLSTSGNPWLVSLLPLAACTNEPLRIGVPVDRLLYENIRELTYVWKTWFPELPIVKIDADVVDDVPEPERAKTAQFFTGGVDSLFTLLRHTRSFTPDAPFEIDDLITICGYDIPLRNAEAFGGRHARQQRAASELGKELIDVFANNREAVIARIRKVDMVCSSMWAKVAHACGLAGIALALEKRFRKVVISSSYTYKQQAGVPYGTSPLTDHLLSTRNLNVFHYGSGFSRAEKVLYIAPSEAAMRTIQVCFWREDERNCCNCLKCYQTMIPLEIAGALKRCTTFEVDSLDLSRVEKLYANIDAFRPFVQELHGLALEHGKTELAAALQESYRRSDLIARRRRLGDWLTTKPVLWRLVPRLRKSLHKMEADSVLLPRVGSTQPAAAKKNGKRVAVDSS